MPKAQFSLRNTMQCDSTLFVSISTGRVVTGGQYSSQMKSSFTEPTNDRRAMVWRPQGEGYADCNIVEVERFDGVNHGLDGYTIGWPYITVCV